MLEPRLSVPAGRDLVIHFGSGPRVQYCTYSLLYVLYVLFHVIGAVLGARELDDRQGEGEKEGDGQGEAY